MVCKECGKEIPEGAFYCEACGAPLDEPVVLNVSKEDIKRAEKEQKAREREKAKTAAVKARTETLQKRAEKQRRKIPADESKRIDVVGYFRSLGSDFHMLAAFVGALALYLSPFMNWIWEEVHDVRRKANLFEIGLKSSMVEEDGSVIAMGATIVLVLAIIALLIGVWMLLLSASDYIRGLRRFSANPIMRLAPIVAMLVIFLLVYNNKTYTLSYDSLQKNIELAEKLGAGSSYDAGHGTGPVFYIAGLVLYTLGTLSDLAGRRNTSGVQTVNATETIAEDVSEKTKSSEE